jgi:ATP-binding cassette, subfamily B, bacterial MsbA
VELYLRLLRFVKPYWPRLALAMAFMSVVGVTNAGYAYLMKLVTDDILVQKKANMLVPIALTIILMVIVKGVFDYFQTYFMASVGQRVVTDIRRLVFDRVQRQPLSFFDKNPTGVIISRITSDINLVQGAVSDAFTAILKELVTFVGLVGYAFYTDWRLAAVSFVVIPSVVYPISTFGKRLRKNSVQNQKAMARFTTFLHETITAQRIVKAFAMEKYELERFSQENESLFRVVMRRYKIKALSSPIVEVIAVVALGLIIWYGGSKVISGALTQGEFLSFMTALALLYNPIRSLNKENHNVQQGLGAAQRVFEYIDTVPEISEKPDAKELRDVQGIIDFDGVTFKYEDKVVLKDLTLRIHRNETVAIVGESGGGKTTLVNLIPRFYDVAQGAIRIDGIDVRDVTLDSLRRNVALVTQDVILFNDTVVSNIIHGSPMDIAHVEAAIESAYASDFVAKLPKKLETVVGEKGTRLSGGQKQRVAIARALYKNAPILILDEATSALDTASEVEVQKALDNLMKGRTTIVIAHRLSTIVNADRIVVLHNGSIVQQGTHQELLEHDGPYRKLYELQFRDEPEKKVIRMARRKKSE